MSRSTTSLAARAAYFALWLGLAGGLLRGLAFWTFQSLGLLSWQKRFLPIDLNIVWLEPLLDSLILPVLALALVPVVLLLRVRTPLAGIAAALSAVSFYLLLSMPGRFEEYGVALLSAGVGSVVYRFAAPRTERLSKLVSATVPALGVAFVGATTAVALGGRIAESVELSRLPQSTPGAPNVLLIVLDTLRADRLGAYGYRRPTTPFLDRLAGESVLFENAFATSSWTLPSHASMFTGRLPYEHRATLEPLDGRFRTLAEALAQAGYATAGFAANGAACVKAFGLARGFQRWENIFISVADSVNRSIWGWKLTKFVWPYVKHNRNVWGMNADEVNERFLRWLHGRPERPFFAFLNYMDVHQPLFPPREYAVRFSPTPDELTWRPVVQPVPHGKMSDAYDASLAYLDSRLEALFGDLDQRGLLDNLVLVVTADHGEAIGEHGYGHRIGLHLSQIKVPLMIRFSGKLAAGTRVKKPVSLALIPATIAQLTKLGNSPFPGPSLLDVREDPGDAGTVVSEITGGPWPGVNKSWPVYQGWVKSLITPRWHILVQQNGKTELYDWPVDPAETRDFAQTPEGAEEVARLRPFLAEMITAESPH